VKLGVIGEPCVDFIYRPEKQPEKKLGGILYSTVSLAVISSPENEVYPIMNLGEDEFDSITGFLSGFQNINQEFINKCSHKTRVVSLYYKSHGGSTTPEEMMKTYDREESSTQPTLPVSGALLGNAARQLDAILVNLVSGVDIELDTFTELRRLFGGYIHMDLHNLIMRTYEDGSRLREPFEGWENWCSLCDTLQMNETEICVMPPKKTNEEETARIILGKENVKALVITRGKEGLSMYWMKDSPSNNKELVRSDVKAIERDDFVDSTGCGDVFASSFFYNNCMNKLSYLDSSLEFANKMASWKTSLFGVEELSKLG